MSADRLREAATVLRERAEEATPGPWEARRNGLVAHSSANPRWQWPSHATADAQMWEGQRERQQADAAYIATMHPGVALALADLLDLAARADESGEVWPDGGEPLRVADLILGADS